MDPHGPTDGQRYPSLRLPDRPHQAILALEITAHRDGDGWDAVKDGVGEESSQCLDHVLGSALDQDLGGPTPSASSTTAPHTYQAAGVRRRTATLASTALEQSVLG